MIAYSHELQVAVIVLLIAAVLVLIVNAYRET